MVDSNLIEISSTKKKGHRSDGENVPAFQPKCACRQKQWYSGDPIARSTCISHEDSSNESQALQNLCWDVWLRSEEVEGYFCFVFCFFILSHDGFALSGGDDQILFVLALWRAVN